MQLLQAIAINTMREYFHQIGIFLLLIGFIGCTEHPGETAHFSSDQDTLIIATQQHKGAGKFERTFSPLRFKEISDLSYPLKLPTINSFRALFPFISDRVVNGLPKVAIFPICTGPRPFVDHKAAFFPTLKALLMLPSGRCFTHHTGKII